MRRHVIAGIDPSSRKLAACVTAVGEEEDIDMRTFELPMNKSESTAAAYDWMEELLTAYPNDKVFVFLEEPVAGRGGMGVMKMISETNGALIAAAIHNGAEVIRVNNKHWKKEVLGNGNIAKPKIPGALHVIWPEAWRRADGDPDLIDAAAINRLGDQVLRMRIRISNRRNLERAIVRRRKS